MTDPREVLKNLASNTDPSERVIRVYRMLYNPELYRILARLHRGDGFLKKVLKIAPPIWRLPCEVE